MKNKLILLCTIPVLLAMSCKNVDSNSDRANSLVNKSINISGGETISMSEISFDFRDKRYVAIRNEGIFSLQRHYKDTLGLIADKLSNKGFERYVNGELYKLPDSIASKYANSVNSVHYFSVLPYGLNDAAVNKKFIGLQTISGQEFYKIKVFFDEEGGGQDYEDVFLYWINTTSFKVDYLAYSYKTDGGGIRFRKAYNERIIDGVRFVDYENYKPKIKQIGLNDVDILFENDKLELISLIELENIEVRRIKQK